MDRYPLNPKRIYRACFFCFALVPAAGRQAGFPLLMDRVGFPISSGPWFALGNRIHWLCGGGSANWVGRRAAFSELDGSGFAYGNRNHWLCGQGSANFAAARVALSASFGLGFALGNRIHWLSGEGSANLVAAMVSFFISFGPGFALENRNHWLCEEGSANFAAVRFANPHSFGPGFALENRIHWLCGDAYTNREPVDLEKTAELKKKVLLSFWRHRILNLQIQTRSYFCKTACAVFSIFELLSFIRKRKVVVVAVELVGNRLPVHTLIHGSAPVIHKSTA